MSYYRDIAQDISSTNQQIRNKNNVVRQKTSWLGHRRGSAILDYDLLRGATIEEMITNSGRQKKSVIDHIKHLETEHGLIVSEKDGIHSLVSENSKLFDNVQLKDIYKAIEEYNSKGAPDGLASSKFYDVKIKGALYPPKPIMAYANYYASGIEPHNYFSGGANTPCFKAYERLGLDIIAKGKSIDVTEEFAAWLLSNTFDSYRSYIGETTKDTVLKLKEIDQFFPEIELFKIKESRIKQHTNRILSLLKKKERVKNEAFFEYAKKNSNGIPKAIIGKNNYLKFLEETFIKPNYWVFQGNPEFYNITKALKEDHLKSWKVGAHKDKIKLGDKIIIWQTGTASGCYALAEVTSEVHVFQEEEFELQHYNSSLNNDASERVKLKIIKYLADTPVLWSSLKDLPEFSKFKGGNQGTNFSATEQEYNTINNMSKNNSPSLKEPQNKYPVNQILYGPPGTGKTYNTINKAIAIVNPDFDLSLDREIVKMEYDRLVKEGQIVFTTFHQSLAYEDFVEGIKPSISEDDDLVKYAIESGIFKEVVNKAKGVSGIKKYTQSIDFSKANYFKMSLGGKNRKHIHDWCLDANVVALGWGANEDFSSYLQINDWSKFREKFTEEFPHLVDSSKYHIQAMFSFQKMKKGDVVVVSLGNHVLDAVGIIEGDYEYDPNNKYGFHHLRKVNWLSINMNTSPDLFIDKGISQQSIYEFYKQDIKIEAFTEYFSSTPKENVKSNYVLIIDEINRGNVSAIFGELITLIEESKRLGNKEALEVTLPYSKESFGVPNNLFIIGTMNTADRSVEALDTALRRRFQFEEMLPDPTILKDRSVEAILLEDVLETINNRIEALLDRDHTIGHSYLLGIKSKKDLANTFNNNIVPLLQEYFYGDYGKIGLVLGKGFVEAPANIKVTFADFTYEDKDDFENNSFNLIKVTEYTIIEAIYTLLGRTSEDK
ncbi:EVE domain-containing protein [Flavicella marina]|uniref:EVE domain-containing protein n=1 Tax=Flavicella marina TaxID=1475951 RepID=UPI001265774E|nr:EVE domain-containing protein [Flavicella marina]